MKLASSELLTLSVLIWCVKDVYNECYLINTEVVHKAVFQN